MPLWRLQTVGSDTLEFLYPNRGRGSSITLHGDAAYCLRAFYGLVTNMIRGAWLEYIRRHNPETHQAVELSEFLFGSERNNLSTAREVLLEIDGPACFYCEQKMRTTPAVDHFIPWSRFPHDLGHNFVLTHQSCNSQKSDFIPAVGFLKAWTARNSERGQALEEAFRLRRVPVDLSSSLQVARWAYAQLEITGGKLWAGKDRFEPLKEGWRAVLASCAA